MVFHAIVFIVTGQTWFIVGHTLFKLVPVWPAILYCVFLKHVQSFDMLMIWFFSKAMESLTFILLSKSNVMIQTIFAHIYFHDAHHSWEANETPKMMSPKIMLANKTRKNTSQTERVGKTSQKYTPQTRQVGWGRTFWKLKTFKFHGETLELRLFLATSFLAFHYLTIS